MVWNSLMITGLIIGIGGIFICLGIIVFCIIRMEFDLKVRGIKTPLFHLYKGFIVYREYKILVNSKSKGFEKDKLNKKIKLIKQALIIAPFILLISLLTMVIGKSL